MQLAALVAIFVANSLAGLSYLAQKLALEGLPPATIIVLRNAVALVAMGIWIRARGGLVGGYSRADLLRLFVLGTLSFALPLWLGIVGVELSTAANGSILVLLEPGTILLLSWWLLREELRALQLAGVAVGLAGALFVVLEDAPAGDLFAAAHLRGNLLLALHGILWGTYTPLARVLTRRHRPLDVTFVSMLFANVVLVPAALFEADEWRAGPELASALAWTLALGVFVSWFGTFLWNYAVQRVRGRTIAPFVFLQPVAGATGAWLVLGEELSREAWLGAGLIAGGVVLTIVSGAKGSGAQVEVGAGAST